MRKVAEGHAAATLLFVWDRGWLLCVGRHESTAALHRNLPPLGARFRANGSAAAKVLLAYRPWHEIAALTDLSSGNGDGRGSLQSIEADLHRVRRRGYAGGRCMVVATIARPNQRGSSSAELNQVVEAFASQSGAQVMDWRSAALSTPGAASAC